MQKYERSVRAYSPAMQAHFLSGFSQKTKPTTEDFGLLASRFSGYFSTSFGKERGWFPVRPSPPVSTLTVNTKSPPDFPG